MMSRRRILLIGMAALLAALLAVYLAYDARPGDYQAAAFARLKKIKEQKKQEVLDYFKEVRRLAGGIVDDEAMTGFFKTVMESKSAAGPELEYQIDRHYVENYGEFYDILFVDETGVVFHSVKKESDYGKSLLEGDLARSNIGKALRERGQKSFVEYGYYDPSQEPAAFFITPLSEGGRLLGWFVLQCPINRVNAILTDRRGLGRSGEVYLVNQERLMLSESRFIEDSTILKLKVDTEAVRDGMKNETGQRIIRDYRGKRVFSSYLRFEVFNAQWLVITEMDEAEVLTEHYRRHERYFNSRLARYLADSPRRRQAAAPPSSPIKRVDMNEFAKAEPAVLLQTVGVSSCTAVALFLPHEFGYLVHLSPTDEVYESPALSRWFLKERRTDFLGELIRRITRYNVYPYQMDDIQFVIVATHLHSFGGAVRKILDNGLELANIRFLYHPQARAANVTLDADSNSVRVEWLAKEAAFSELASEVEDLGALVRRLAAHSEEGGSLNET